MSLLAQDVFVIGMANLERFFRRKLHPFDRDIYYAAVQSTTRTRWEKVIQYACVKAKTLPKPTELREWLGITEELSPAELDHNFKPGTVRGISPRELCEMAAAGQDLPFDDDCWKDEAHRTCYLEQPYVDPPPEDAGPAARLAWIRKYAEQAEELYEKCKPA